MEPNALPTLKSKTTNNVSAILDSLTTAILAPNALKVLSGVLRPINASLSVVKIQCSLNLQESVFVTLDLVFLEDSAKNAPITISSPMDFALLAQSTQPSTQQPKTVTAYLDSSPTNGEFVLESVVPMKFTILRLKDAHACRV